MTEDVYEREPVSTVDGDGNEIEEEPVDEEQTTGDQDKEMLYEDLSEASVEDLEATFEEIQASADTFDGLYGELLHRQGINQTLAYTIEQALPETLPEHYPLASYTQSFTVTNYNPALESMAKKAGKMLQKIIESAAKLIRKLLKTISDFIKGLWKNNETAQKNKNNAILLLEYKDSINGQISEDLLDELEQAENQVIESLAKEYESRFSALTQVVAEGGEIKDKIRSHGQQFESYVTQAKQRLQYIIEACNQLTGDDQALYADNNALKNSIIAKLSRVDQDSHEFNPSITREQLQTLRAEVEQFKQEEFTGTINHDLIRGWILSEEVDPSEVYLVNGDEVLDEIDDLGKCVKELEKVKNTTSDRDLSQAFNHALSQMRDVVVSYRDYAQCLNAVHDETNVISKFILNYPKQYIEQVTKLLKTKGSEKDQERIEELIKEARKRADL